MGALDGSRRKLCSVQTITKKPLTLTAATVHRSCLSRCVRLPHEQFMEEYFCPCDRFTLRYEAASSLTLHNWKLSDSAKEAGASGRISKTRFFYRKVGLLRHKLPVSM